MDVSKIDFSKVEGIIDARILHGNSKHLVEQVGKGYILATNDVDYEALHKALIKHVFEKGDKK